MSSLDSRRQAPLELFVPRLRSKVDRVSSVQVRLGARVPAHSKWELRPTNLMVESVFALGLLVREPDTF